MGSGECTCMLCMSFMSIITSQQATLDCSQTAYSHTHIIRSHSNDTHQLSIIYTHIITCSTHSNVFTKSINFVSLILVSDREWYSYHFPELIKIVSDNYLYARAVQCIESRKDLTDEKVEKLEEILMDGAKAKAVQEAARTSMGKDVKFICILFVDCYSLSNCLSVCLSIFLSVRPSVHLSVYLSVRVSVRPSVCLSVHPCVYLSVSPSVCLCVCLSVRLCLPICLSVHLSVHSSVCLSVHPCVYLSVSPSVCLSVCPSVSAYLSVRPSVCPFICLCVCLSVHLSMCLPVCLSVHLSVCLSVYLSVCLSVHLCLPVCLSVHLSVCLSVCPSICLCVCPPVHVSSCVSVCPPVCLFVCSSIAIHLHQLFVFRDGHLSTRSHKHTVVCEQSDCSSRLPSQSSRLPS